MGICMCAGGKGACRDLCVWVEECVWVMMGLKLNHLELEHLELRCVRLEMSWWCWRL